MDNNLKSLGNNFIVYMTETAIKPEGTRLVGTLIAKSNYMVQMKWGWVDKYTKENTFSLTELQQIKYDNNLSRLLSYEDGSNTSVNFIFQCLECIRRHFGKDKKIFFVKGGGFHQSYIYL